MLPVFFSVKKMRPSGANLSETGNLRPVRRAFTGEVMLVCGIIEGLTEKRTRMVVLKRRL